MNRRDFLKLSLLTPVISYARRFDNRLKIVLPKKPFELYHLKGKQKGKRILLIGGIHGNEIGAYKAADLLIDSEIKRGEVIIIPRSNFTSILANVRGYNGDMNRKFSYISKKDPDYPFVEFLKSAILEYRPDVVISMHDGFGFASKSRRAWGQSVVIDEVRFKEFNLYTKALFVINNANKFLNKKITLINTRTFSGVTHREQKKALTGWCLNHNIEAYCIEASKQLRSIDEKIKTHLIMLREFFKLYNVEIASLDEMISNPKIKKNRISVNLNINSHRVKITHSTTFYVPRNSVIEVDDFSYCSDYLVPRGVNLNWRSFHFSNLTFYAQRDYKKIFKVRIKKV